MKKIGIIILLLISINTFGQNLDECGIDNNPKLTQPESEFLSNYMDDDKGRNFDFSNKKIIFVTGNYGQKNGTKSEYFSEIKKMKSKGGKITTRIIDLTENEKIESGNYDVIITYWTKSLTKRRKKKIIEGIKAGR